MNLSEAFEKLNIYLDDMCHAIGFDPEKTRKNQRVHEYYRNYFCAGASDKEAWEELVKLGYAERTPNAIVDNYYYVSQEGFKLLSKVYKIDFKPRD